MAGRVHRFGDHVDTDTMFPGDALQLSIAEAVAQMFRAVAPRWFERVNEGDIVVGGVGFGTGSARPVSKLLCHLGVGAVLADSMSAIFQRNCINDGLLAVAAPGITSYVDDGDIIEVDASSGIVRMAGSDLPVRCQVLPDQLLRRVMAGGAISELRKAGFLPPPR